MAPSAWLSSCFFYCFGHAESLCWSPPPLVDLCLDVSWVQDTSPPGPLRFYRKHAFSAQESLGVTWGLATLLVLDLPRQTLEVQGNLRLAVLPHKVPCDLIYQHISLDFQISWAESDICPFRPPATENTFQGLRTISLKKLSLVSFG